MRYSDIVASINYPGRVINRSSITDDDDRKDEANQRLDKVAVPPCADTVQKNVIHIY